MGIMIRTALKVIGVVLALAVLGLLFGLGNAHLGIRRENPPLPDAREVLALAQAPDRPVRLSWIETAHQCTPGEGEASCVVHPVFVLEWADGRLLLVDAGMEADAAREFGTPMELLLGAAPPEPGRSLADALGSSRDRVAGLVFTHLHMDHTQGIAGLCPDGAPPLPIFQTPAQAERPNYTVTPGQRQVEAAPCASSISVADRGLTSLGDLPGVGVVRAAGHTPGSQMIVAWVGAEEPRGFVLAGDVVFAKARLGEDRPKDLVYRLLVTPENEAQLARVRAWLRELETRHGLTAIPSHDRVHLLSLDLPRYRP
jgi:glyoxylase-like metal-dependent hydrolase (beta-lactamase superfamily II)